MKVIYRLSIILMIVGAFLTVGSAGASDLGMEMKVLAPYIIIGTTCLIIGALGMYSVSEVSGR